MCLLTLWTFITPTCKRENSSCGVHLTSALQLTRLTTVEFGTHENRFSKVLDTGLVAGLQRENSCFHET